MKRLLSAAALVAGLLVPALAQAQSIGIAARGGTLGLGGEAELNLNRRLGIRGGIGSVPVQPSAEFDNVRYTIKPPSTLANIGLDLYPAGGGFRLSGGFMFQHDVALDAEPTDNFDIDGTTYTRDQVGTLTAAFDYTSTAPYGTIGFASRGRIGMTFDIGAAVMGEPNVRLSATGGSMSGNLTFQEHLQNARDQIQQDAGKYMKVLPILSLGIRVGF